MVGWDLLPAVCVKSRAPPASDESAKLGCDRLPNENFRTMGAPLVDDGCSPEVRTSSAGASVLDCVRLPLLDERPNDRTRVTGI
jgi:hypothetical protein